MSRATLSATPYSFAFRPTSIAGCQLWLDGADASQVTYSTGSNISQWKDKSGNANHGSQSTAGQQPYYSTASNAVVFSGAQVMTCPLSASSTIETCFFVFSTTINKGVLIGAVTSPGRNIDFYESYNMRIVQQYNALVLSSTYTFSPNTTVLATTQTTSTNSYIFMYGSQTNSNSTVANYGTGITSVIGTNGSDPPVEPFNGPIFEMIIFNTALTTAQRQQVEGYLAWKWGTQASLPGGHLYASAAPTGPNALGISRPALSAALAPTPVRALGKASYTGIFTPTSIAGCRLWLDAADATTFTISSGSNVSTWSDKSGSSSSLSNTTGNPPYFTTYNGYPTVSFRGSLSSTSNVLSNPTFSIAPANISIFIITQALQNGGSYIHPGILTIFPNPLSGVDYRDGLTITGGNASSSRFDVYGGSGTITGIDYSGSGLTPRGVYSVVNTSNVLYGYANGTQWGTNTFTFNTTNVGIALGMRHLGTLRAEGGASAFDGNISEVIIYNTALTTTQRQQVEGYLAWKWGLQASLPPFAGPLSLSGCSLWLDGADSSSVSMTLSGSSITAWKDKSGNGVSFTIGGTPTLSNAVYNGLSSVYFNGSTNFINTTFNLNLINHSFFIVVSETAGGNAGVLVFYSTGGSVDDVYSPNALLFASPQFSIKGSYSSQPSSTLAYGVYSETSLPTGSLTVYKNGTSVITNTGVTAASSTGLVIGSRVYTTSYTYFMTGYVSEVLVYSTALTDTQRQQVEGYLAWKWGTQANLVNTHPYYSSSPFHAYAAATPIGASLRPAISQALVPAGVRSMVPIKKPIASLTLTNSGSTDSYIASYLSNGYVNSIARQAGTGADVGNGIATDTNGNIIITGHYSSNPFTLYTTAGSAFSTTLVNSGQTAFVAQYSSSGAVNWVARFSGSSVGLFCKTDSSNNIYVFGYFTSAPLTAYSSSGTAFGTTISTLYYFLVKYNSSGTIQWIANIGGTGQTNQNSLTCDTNGNVIVTCTGGGITPLNSDGTSYTGSGILGAYRVNGFIVYYNTSGTIQWVASFAGGSRFWNQAISVDSSGNVYCSGYSLGGFAQIYNASGTGVITIAGASGQNGYIAKYTSTGTNVSGTAYGGSGVTAAPLSQVTDSNADTTIVGTFTGTTFIAYSNNSTSQPFSNTLSNPGTTCGFIVKYNSSFVVQWTANIQAATGVATPTGVTCDSLNNIYVSVYTTGNVTIYSSNGSAASTITNTGTNTSFIVKFSSAGLFIWAARQSGGASTSQYLYGIVTDSIGNPYAVGAYTSASGFVYSTGF